MQERNLTELRFFHITSVVIGTLLLGVLAWIGTNVAHIPVIDEEMQDIKTTIRQVVMKELDDHETRIRIVEMRQQKK